MSESIRTGGRPHVAIIGAGWGGIAAAVNLKRRGIESFTILERQAGPGGVWRANRFPGLGVDVPAHLYSFSFRRFYDWTRTHPMREEILRYTDDIVDEWDIRKHMRFGVDVDRIVWNEAEQGYDVHLRSGAVERFEVVVSAVGVFNTPRLPAWPGLDEFGGRVFHTSQWDHSADLRGKRVAVVGTGATCIQIVPAIAPETDQLYVFQREPGWVIPRNDKDWSDEERRAMARPYAQKLKRVQMYWRFERLIFGMRRVREKKTKIQLQAEAYIVKHFDSRPDLKAAVTPTYPFGGKRPLFDGRFYETLTRENVELVPQAVVRATPTGIVAADGSERSVDVLVLATGYTVSDYLSTIEVVGRDGLRLHQVWGNEPTAFLGICVPRFPNFFIMYGPNTNGGGSISVQLERQAAFIARHVKRMTRGRVGAVEARPWAFRAWDGWVSWRNSKQVFAFSKSYYRGPSGKVLTEWPGTLTGYWLWTRALGTLGCRMTRRQEEPSTVGSPDVSAAGDDPVMPLERSTVE